MTSERIIRIFLWCSFISAIILTQACGHRRVIFEKRHLPQERKLQQKGVYHAVERHQTLYRICKTYGIDIREVASINGISDHGRIRAGQHIFIPGAKRVLEVDIVIDDVVAEPEDDGAKKNAAKKMDLMWPAEGKHVDFFEEEERKRHQGIDIASPSGTPIKAAGAGRVIYSGNAIRGYGNLIILRHSGEYVSVYAHNQVNLVEEGRWVEKGELIGRVGQSGNASGPHLHFEIRKNNRAVDPLDFLK